MKRLDWVVVAALAGFVMISLLLRVILPFEQSINGGWVKFTSNDAYFYQRLIDNIAANFPHLTDFDPYLIFPGGSGLTDMYMSSRITAGVAWVIGMGSPSPHLVDLVSAFIPPICLSLAIIPVYFIGKLLFNKWAGIAGAGLLAIMPGEFLGRTIIGSNDTPAFEILFSTVFIALAIGAYKVGAGKGLEPRELLSWQGVKAKKRILLLSALAGLVLGLYLCTWIGALLFVFILSLYAGIRMMKSYPGDKTGATGIISMVILGVALAVFAPFAPAPSFVLPIALAIGVLFLMLVIAKILKERGFAPVVFIAAMVAITSLGLAVCYLVSPEILKEMIGKLAVFLPSGESAATTSEMQPLLAPEGFYDKNAAWGNFPVTLFLVKNVALPGVAVIAICLMIYQAVRKPKSGVSFVTMGFIIAPVLAIVFLSHVASVITVVSLIYLLSLIVVGKGEGENHLLIIWSLVLMGLMMIQRRFAYYFAVNVAVLAGWFIWMLAAWIWQKTKEARQGGKGKNTSYKVAAVLAIFSIIAYIISPNITKAVELVTPHNAPYAPSNAWIAALTWLRENTPEPLGDDSFYYKCYKWHEGTFPVASYGVVAWWDYGYWITQVAHRIPCANPGQEPDRIKRVTGILMSADADKAGTMMDELGAEYLIVDQALITGKYWAMVIWNGEDIGKYAGLYYMVKDGRKEPVIVYYPEYYSTLAVRLFSFDGQGVRPKPTTIKWEYGNDGQGDYKKLVELREHATYDEANEYISKAGGNCRLVGLSPFISPIPLEAVSGLSMVYSSGAVEGGIPEVKIYVRSAGGK